MLKLLANELLAENLLTPDDSVVVGVSGGADSMALLHLLLGLNEKMDWRLGLHVAHLNHALREDQADEDAAFVQAAADSLSLPCTIETRDVAKIAREESGGLEEVGRRQRYTFFERVCLRADAKIVAVGHHADDNAETILHRILRGTGLRGLAGIPQSRPLTPGSEIRIVRPLLGLRKQTLIEFLGDHDIAHREDRTNTSLEPMRNRVRHVLLPMIEEQVNPQVRDALIRLGEQARWLGDYLRETVHKTFETLIISRTDQEVTLNVEALARKSRIVQTEIVRLAYTSFGLGEQDLSFANLVSVVDLIAATESGKRATLPGGMTVERRYHHLVFSFPSDEPREMVAPQVAVHLPGKTVLPVRRLVIECTIEEASSDDIPRLRAAASKMEEYVSFEAVHPPLVVRGRRAGERFFPLGAPGTKKLSEYLIDAKVDAKDRERVAVVCDQLGPIWVVGHRIDDRVKLTELTRKVLHLRARPL